MRVAFALLLMLHGAIHLLGFAKGLGLAEVAALKLPIGRVAGAFWLLAALGFASASVMVLLAPSVWWWVGLPTVLVSQALIVLAWSDARFGTLPNVLALVPLALAMLQASPSSFRSVYQRQSTRHLASAPASSPLVTEQDLAPLPPLVQAYLRRVGIVGKPRVQGFRARFHGRFRQSLDADWMEFTSEQTNLIDPPVRLFHMTASRKGVPIEGLHVFAGEHARMQIRVASLIDVVDAQGPEMDQGETVTIFNDLCVWAPGALLDLPVSWTTLDARSVRGAFTRGDQAVSAVLTFDEAGDLVNFVSEDRFLSADGKTFQKLPWSTPMRDHREIGGLRLPGRGDATWTTPSGDFVYGEFLLDEIVFF